MKKYNYILISAVLLGAFTIGGGIASFKQLGGGTEMLGDSIGVLPAYKTSNTPFTAIVPRSSIVNLYAPTSVATSSAYYANTFCINNSSPDCITAWPSASSETDPVWLAASSSYLTVSDASSTYEPIITVLDIARGGTGTSTAPTFGQLLMGNAGGTYDLVATTSLGISGGVPYTGATSDVNIGTHSLTSGNILTTTDSTYTLGNSTNLWSSVWTDKISFNADSYISYNATFGNIYLIPLPGSSVRVSGSIDPNGTANLGATNNYWANTYSTNYYLNSTAYLGGSTAGLAKLTGNFGLTGAFFDSTNASGTIGNVLLSTGTSTLWATTSTLGISGGGGTPGGSDTQVQFNAGGAFAGDSGMTFNSSTDLLTVTSLNASDGIRVNNPVGMFENDIGYGLSFGDGDTGFYENSDDQLYLKSQNTVIALFPSGASNAIQVKHLIPTTDNGQDLGGASNRWRSFRTNLLTDTGSAFGIATTTPSQALTVIGNQYLTGAFYDSTNDPGTLGDVLLSTNTGTNWTSTSSLGISGGSGITSLGGQTGSSQSFASSTSGGLDLFINSATDVHTFTLQPATDFTIPLTASTTEWAYVYDTVVSNFNGYLDYDGNALYDGSLVLSADWSERTLVDETGAGAFDWTSSSTLTIPGYTDDGFVKTSGGDGTLIIDTSTYLTDYTETDPIWIASSTDYLTSADAASTYQPIGSYLTSAITSLGGQTGATQTFSTSTSGNLELFINSSANNHQFTLQPASGYALITTASSTDWSSVANIVNTNYANWNTAYGWGDWSGEGFITGAQVPANETDSAHDNCSEITGCVVGAITGNESITLSGDVSGTGSTAITTTIGAGKITEAMLNVAGSPTDDYALIASSTSAGGFVWKQLTSGGSLFTDAGAFTYLTETTADLALGSNATATAPFWWDTSATSTYLADNGKIEFGQSTGTMAIYQTPYVLGDTTATLYLQGTTAYSYDNFYTYIQNSGIQISSLYEEPNSLSSGGIDILTGHIEYGQATSSATYLETGTISLSTGAITVQDEAATYYYDAQGVGISLYGASYDGNADVYTPGYIQVSGATTFSSDTYFTGTVVTVSQYLTLTDAVLQIPNGTTPTANDPGELAHDTSDNQLILDDYVVGTAKHKIWSTTIASSSPAFTNSGLLPVPQQIDGYTITNITCFTVSGTNKVIAVEDASANSSEDITCDSDGATDDGSITNATYTASELSFIDFGATSGAVDYVSISVFGTWTRE